MYKQLYTIKNMVYTGGGCTIMFYTIVLTYDTYEYMLMYTYVSYMTKTHD